MQKKLAVGLILRKENKMIRLSRDNEPDLEFDGELVASSNSRIDHDQARWTELKVYLTTRHKWVFQILGRSAIAGEITRSKVVICKTKQELAEAAFYKRDKNGGKKLSYPAKQLMIQLYDRFKEPEFDLKETI